MSYNGYTNEASYTVALMLDNEYKLYRAARGIAKEYPHDAPERIHSLVRRTLDGETGLLSESQRQAWRRDIRRDGGMAKVNWQEMAETRGDERRKIAAKAGSSLKAEATRRSRDAKRQKRNSRGRFA